MTLATDDQSLAALAAALRAGRLTADHSPPFVADLLDALLRERQAMTAEITEMEQVYLMSKTHASLRSEYVRGFRDAQEQLSRRLPDDGDLILGLSPGFAQASEGARFVG